MFTISLWIKWSMMIAISAVSASLLFIILTYCDLLPGTDIAYLGRPNRTHSVFYTHPYDSMVEIWTISLFLIGEIVLALALYILGQLNKHLYRKMSEIRRRKQNFHVD